MDVFVRVAPLSSVRSHLAAAVLARLAGFPDVRVRPLLSEADVFWNPIIPVAASAPAFLCTDEFWNESVRFADQHASGDVYALLDDDQLPLGPDFFHLGRRLLLEHPEFAFISSVSINGEVALPRWDVMLAPAERDRQIVVAGSAGTPFFARARSLAHLRPQSSLARADTEACESIQRAGLKVGFARALRHNHLGYGISQAVPEWSNHPGPPA
jgi:hypothetical protein